MPSFLTAPRIRCGHVAFSQSATSPASSSDLETRASLYRFKSFGRTLAREFCREARGAGRSAPRPLTSRPLHICITRACTAHTPPRLQDRKVRTRSGRPQPRGKHRDEVSSKQPSPRCRCFHSGGRSPSCSRVHAVGFFLVVLAL